MFQFIEKIDSFSSPLPQFNLAGKKSVKTYCGGLVTFLVFFITFVFAVTKLASLMQKKNPSINNYVRKDAFLNEENYSFTDENFMMAFTVESYWKKQGTHDDK